MAALWISWTDEDGNEGSARWESGVNDQAIDHVLFDAQRRLGPPETEA